MSHNHNHISPIQSLNWVYYLAIALNFGFVILEAAVGLGYHSMGLLSDAGHKLFDCNRNMFKKSLTFQGQLDTTVRTDKKLTA